MALEFCSKGVGLFLDHPYSMLDLILKELI
jgi:hypothetical protein